MDFEPVSDDHAIEEVVFGCNLGRRITPAELRAVFDLHSQVSEELPAASIETEGAGGVQFAYLRPNGTATWSFQVFENNLVVVCTRYSRWAKVWGASKRYMALALGVMQDLDQIEAVGFTLAVVDRFRANKEKSHSATLFSQSKWMMPASLEITGAWHNHVGWFDDSKPDWKILNHLNIDCRYGQESKETNSAAMKDIVIRHSQQCRFREFPKLSDVMAEDGPLLDLMPSYLHECNKSVLDDLLSEEMKSRIHLQGEA